MLVESAAKIQLFSNMEKKTFLAEEGDGACDLVPAVGVDDGAVAEIPGVGALRAGGAVVGAVPANARIGGGIHLEAVTVIDGQGSFQDVFVDDEETVVGRLRGGEDVGDPQGGVADVEGGCSGVGADAVADGQKDGQAVPGGRCGVVD